MYPSGSTWNRKIVDIIIRPINNVVYGSYPIFITILLLVDYSSITFRFTRASIFDP